MHDSPGTDDQQDNQKVVEKIVDDIDSLSGHDTIRVRDMVEELGQATFIPLLMVPALLVISPLSGIPLFSSVCGLTIALIASQLLIGRKRLWLPNFLLQREIKGTRAHGALGKIRKLASFLDRHAHQRLSFLVRPPLNKLVQVLTMLCGLAMPFLELLPFSSSILGISVVLFSVGFLTRDGIYVLSAMILIAVAGMIPAFALLHL
ncbi:exopolysaccharide biosynthesis protein [Pontibaca sp. S1109L]|uniref:Exopolysaccharide biosynthesis protein n=1 Tax=Pontibaca salina TaxID=2795731 RepID=A0A934HSH8_9RHOB|nr:exopolysaccharide biosynthesis protein [Pontibaca salina]